jgi:hypothetical protein
MSRMTIQQNTATGGAWAGDLLDRDHLVPGGVKLDPTEFTADEAGRVYVPGGTVIGRTIAERDNGDGYGAAADADDEIFVQAFDVFDATQNNDAVLYRPNSVIKENFMPGWDDLSSAVQDAVRAKYICTLGAA